VLILARQEWRMKEWAMNRWHREILSANVRDVDFSCRCASIGRVYIYTAQWRCKRGDHLT
jgi:hypothetical protein